MPEPPISALINDPSPFQAQKSAEKTDDSANGARRPSGTKKRVKMADLRTLIETKILSKSDRGLEKIETDAKKLQHTVINVKERFSLNYNLKFGN